MPDRDPQDVIREALYRWEPEWTAFGRSDALAALDTLTEQLRLLKKYQKEEIPWTADGAFEALQDRADRAEAALRNLLAWQPTHTRALAHLHPQHHAAIQAARDLLANTGAAG